VKLNPARSLIILVASAIISWHSSGRSVHAENSVVVESKSLAPNQSGCQVGVFLTNDIDLTGIVLPLEFRTISGNAFMAPGGFSRDHANRLKNSPLGNAGCDSRGCWPAGNITRRTFAVPTVGGNCFRPADPSTSWNTAATLPDFTTPDAIFHASVSTGDPGQGEPITLLPGSDPMVTAQASYLITFTTAGSNGIFIIDTTCVRPFNHLAVTDIATTPVPVSFQAGLISICCACQCGCHADPQCDGATDIIDVILTGNRAFRGSSATNDETCTGHGSTVDGRTDVDCSGATDIVDVVRMVDVAFRGVDPALRFCDPCN